jgi:hypothetical protein
VSTEVVVTVIASIPPTLAAVLGYIVNRRSLRRSIGGPTETPLPDALRAIDTTVDRLFEKARPCRGGGKPTSGSV